MKLTQRWLGMALVVVSSISFGSLAIFARVAYDAGASPQAILSIRFVVGTVLLTSVIAVQKIPIPRGRHFWVLLFLGAVYVCQSLAYFTALTMASVSLVALLLNIYPALVTILAALVLRERPNAYQVVALAFALTGAALMIGHMGTGRPLGVVLALTSALLYSGYVLVSSRVTANTAALPASTLIISGAALVFCGMALVHHPSFPITAQGWAAAIAMSIIGTVVAIICFLAGMQRVGPSTAATISTLEPVVTVLLAILILGETLTLTQAIGGSLILTALVILARRPA